MFHVWKCGPRVPYWNVVFSILYLWKSGWRFHYMMYEKFYIYTWNSGCQYFYMKQINHYSNCWISRLWCSHMKYEDLFISHMKIWMSFLPAWNPKFSKTACSKNCVQVLLYDAVKFCKYIVRKSGCPFSFIKYKILSISLI